MSQDLWQLEERLWREGPEAYAALVDPECLMAFAGVGLLAGAAIPRSLEAVPRWREVAMAPRQEARPTPELAVLGYRAAARRAAGAEYAAWCTSTWRRDRGGWRLVQHQQTPA